MNKKLSVVALALSIVVAGLAWRETLQAHGKMDVSVLTAQGSRPCPPIPNVSRR
jgi:hypothetical protein